MSSQQCVVPAWCSQLCPEIFLSSSSCVYVPPLQVPAGVDMQTVVPAHCTWRGPRLWMGWLLAEWFGTECWLLAGACSKGYFLVFDALAYKVPCSWFLWSTFLFLCISSPPSKSPNEWWENREYLEMLFSQTLSQGTFHLQPRVG